MKGGRLVTVMGCVFALFGVLANWIALIGVETIYIKGTEIPAGRTALLGLLLILLIGGIYKGNPGEAYSYVIVFIGFSLATYLYNYGETLGEWMVAGRLRDIEVMPQAGLFMSIIGAIVVGIGGFIKIPKE